MCFTFQYAAWEDSQDEVERARSVYERALDIEVLQHSLLVMLHTHIPHLRATVLSCSL